MLEHKANIDRIQELIENWHIYENRIEMKLLLEQSTPRKKIQISLWVFCGVDI